ncbi:MAG TPA: glycosyltransferase family 4 protein [Thermoanaerobaculia bacterium]
MTGKGVAVRPRRRVAMLTPLPPTRTGVAHYVSLLLPELSREVELSAFDSLDGYRRSDFDTVIYQLGNNPHHEAMYLEAMKEPGIAVLHDLVLHHLIVELTLARGDATGYIDTLARNHGPAGEAWAQGRAAGMHAELGNFLLPASIEVARRSIAVIVHNRYAAERLRSFGVTTPIHIVPHPYVHESRHFDRDFIRGRFGFAPEHRVIGFFGFLTSAKRAGQVLDAFHAARELDPRLRLLIVGEPAPDIDLSRFDREGIVTTGYVDDDEFPSFYAAADRCVNLRYPSAGETSGTLIRAFDAGLPVAVSDYAQFAEFPEECVFRVPLDATEKDRLVEFFTGDLRSPSAAQRAWLDANARVDLTVRGYLQAMRGEATAGEAPSSLAPLPIFPRLELVGLEVDHEIRLRIRNSGETTLRTRTYGQPEYRMIAKLFVDGVEVGNRWLALPCDLFAGGETDLAVRLNLPERPFELRLFHALQDVPSVDAEPWLIAEAGGAR